MALSINDLNKINDAINGDENITQISISSLDIEKPYLIDNLSVKNARYGKCVLATLYDEKTSIQLKCFLPKRVVECLPEETLNKINSSQRKYTLIYLGQSVPACKDKKAKNLLKLGLVE